VEIRIKTDDIVSVAAAAEGLGKPRSTIYRWVGSGKMVSVRLGEIIFIPRSEVERLCKEQEQEKTEAPSR